MLRARPRQRDIELCLHFALTEDDTLWQHAYEASKRVVATLKTGQQQDHRLGILEMEEIFGREWSRDWLDATVQSNCADALAMYNEAYPREVSDAD